MKQKFSFEYKIAIIMIVILSLVSVIGVYTYKSFSTIVTKVSNEAKPDLKLLAVKTLLSEITDAENQVKSYSITKDTFYLNQYLDSKLKIEESMVGGLFDIDSGKKDNHLVDSLSSLIGKKLIILDELLMLQGEFRVEEALDKVYSKIKSEADKNEAENGDKKWKLFQKLKNLGGDKQVGLESVEENVKEVKSEEKSINDKLIDRELELILADNEVSYKIRKVVEAFESVEMNNIAIQAKYAEIEVSKTNKQIALFCAAIGVLLLFMTFIILNYVKNNNRFRIALKKAKKEAENLAKTKEKFLANMSHEIRTPMNAIAGFSAQIAKGPLTEEQREQMNMVQKSTEHLLYLINDVLDITKLQNGKVKLEKVDFSIKEVLEDVASFVRPMAEEKNTDLVTSYDSELPTYLCGDPYRLRQIVLNILSNAVKFTDEGEISLEVQPVLTDKENTTIRLTVKDSGIGMSEDQLTRVFKEFEQAEVSTSRNYGGTGLGLAITSKLISLFNGKITINSQVSEGTQVLLELPFKIGEKAPEIISKPVELSGKFLAQKRILIVDDESYNRKLLISILRDKNVLLTEAENGRKALEEIKHNNYDVILMDVRMPELNGIEATVKIRKLKDESKKNVPIIALSAAVTEEDKENYFQSGMNGFIAKPFKEEELIVELNKLFEEPVHTVLSKEEQIKKDKNCVDFSELKKLSGNDNNFYLDMLETFVDGSEKGIEKMQEGIMQGDLNQVAEYAHKISSPARHLGADDLYDSLKTIENSIRKKQKIDLNKIFADCLIQFDEVFIQVNKEISKISK